MTQKREETKMFRKNEKTLLDDVIDHDFDKYYTDLFREYSGTLKVGHFHEGNVLARVPLQRASTKYLTNPLHTYCINPDQNHEYSSEFGIEGYRYLREAIRDGREDVNLNVHHLLGGNDLLTSVTSTIVNVTVNAPFKECMEVIAHYQKLAGNNFYGALLRDPSNPNFIINPLHILTALAIMENEEILNNNKFNVILYFHTDRAQSDKDFSTHYSNEDLVRENIEKLMQLYTAKEDWYIRGEAPLRNYEHKKVFIKISESVIAGEVPKDKYYLSAHQVITKGIVAPYYGSSLIYVEGREGSIGYSLSPFKSVNIRGCSFISNRDTELSWSSVCTGDLPRNSFQGMRSLTHANLSSPYTSYPIVPGALAYADAMIHKCLELYTLANILGDTDGKEDDDCQD